MSAFWPNSACFGGDKGDIFNPERGDIGSVADARRLCSGCPVLRECAQRELQMQAVTDFGVVAGVLRQSTRDADVERSNKELQHVVAHGVIPSRTGSRHVAGRLERAEKKAARERRRPELTATGRNIRTDKAIRGGKSWTAA